MRYDDEGISDSHIYFSETAESYYDKAVLLKNQGRRAAAQEYLRTASYWVSKCPEEYVKGLQSRISSLMVDIY